MLTYAAIGPHVEKRRLSGVKIDGTRARVENRAPNAAAIGSRLGSGTMRLSPLNTVEGSGARSRWKRVGSSVSKGVP